MITKGMKKEKERARSVLLVTDGEANVGTTDQKGIVSEMMAIIKPSSGEPVSHKNVVV